MTDGPPLAGRRIMHQQWRDITFVHWRADPARVAPLLPRGTRPDEIDGATWVGLIPFRMVDGALFGGPPVPYVGTFLETNVRVYARDDEGRRGVVFLSLEAERLAVVVAANVLLGIPYRWARMRASPAGAEVTEGTTISYATRRRAVRRRPTSELTVRIGEVIEEPSELDLFLTARFGLHTRVAGRTLWVPNTHTAWPLRRAEVVTLDDELVSAAGLGDVVGATPPESVLFSAGVTTSFGVPRRLRRPGAAGHS